MIRVGGRLHKAEVLEEDEIHPIVLDPSHPVTKLLIKDFDHRLLHAGPDQVYFELRRTYWILRGRQAVKKHQRSVSNGARSLLCLEWLICPLHAYVYLNPLSGLQELTASVPTTFKSEDGTRNVGALCSND